MSVYDYAWGRPGGANLAAAGATGVIRYLSHDPTKDLNAEELADLHHHGIAVALVWETSEERALSGYAGGQQDARDAESHATQLGFPADRPIYMAVDMDPTGAAGPISAYLTGARTILADRAGAYGGYDTMGIATGLGYQWLWQTAAWSAGQWYNGTQLRQSGMTTLVNGVECDINLPKAEDWGGWDNTPTWPGRYIRITQPHMMGADVTTWQQRMHNRGWNITVDGDYGPASETVCKQFQQEKGLVVDGVIGPQTWDAAWQSPIT